ncbi:hypothetical protein BJ956_002934 [Arthrobacter psychrochitiniphilus]|nr:hypothetical protein [Arthrobacter psychrochitiniphilus]
MTAEEATAGCLLKAFSTSAEYTTSPPVTIMSLSEVHEKLLLVKNDSDFYRGYAIMTLESLEASSDP